MANMFGNYLGLIPCFGVKHFRSSRQLYNVILQVLSENRLLGLGAIEHVIPCIAVIYLIYFHLCIVVYVLVPFCGAECLDECHRPALYVYSSVSKICIHSLRSH
jgi:hypothetical protein